MTENESKIGKVAIVGGGRSVGKTLKAQIELLEEVEAYRAIGTVEECRAAVEKMKPKPLVEKKNRKFPHLGMLFYCECGVAYIEPESKYCGNCGQRLQE